MNTMISFGCPHCAQSLEAEEDMAGDSLSCPSCNKTLTVPRIQATPKLRLRQSAAPLPGPVRSAPLRSIVQPVSSSLTEGKDRLFNSVEHLINEHSGGDEVLGLCPAKITIQRHRPFLYLVGATAANIVLNVGLIAVGVPEDALEAINTLIGLLLKIGWAIYILSLVLHGFRSKYGLLVVCKQRVVIFDRVFVGKSLGNVTYQHCLIGRRPEIKKGWPLNAHLVIKVPGVARAGLLKPSLRRARKQYGETILTVKEVKKMLFP